MQNKPNDYRKYFFDIGADMEKLKVVVTLEELMFFPKYKDYICNTFDFLDKRLYF